MYLVRQIQTGLFWDSEACGWNPLPGYLHEVHAVALEDGKELVRVSSATKEGPFAIGDRVRTLHHDSVTMRLRGKEGVVVELGNAEGRPYVRVKIEIENTTSAWGFWKTDVEHA